MFEGKHTSVELKTLFSPPALGFKDALANPGAFKTGPYAARGRCKISCWLFCRFGCGVEI